MREWQLSTAFTCREHACSCHVPTMPPSPTSMPLSQSPLPPSGTNVLAALLLLSAALGLPELSLLLSSLLLSLLLSVPELSPLLLPSCCSRRRLSAPRGGCRGWLEAREAGRFGIGGKASGTG